MPMLREEDNKLSMPMCDGCGEAKSVVEHNGEEYDYCPNCNEPAPTFETPEEELCEACGEQAGWISHHTSYVFNTTIEVCSDCHGVIHSQGEKYSEYEPLYSRKEATERGIFDG